MLIALVCSPAYGGSYDDFSRGVMAYVSGDWAGAIAAFDPALADKDLPASLRPIALLDRGVAHEQLKAYPQAVSDLSAAISLKPDYISAILSRARVYVEAGNVRAAGQDCYNAWQLHPKDSQLLWDCGYILWNGADYSGAIPYFENENYAAPTSARSVLWLELARQKAHSPGEAEFARFVALLKPRGWLESLFDLYLGKTTPEVVISGAGNAAHNQLSRYLSLDPRDRMTQIGAASAIETACAAEFYVGEWQLLNGQGDQAKSLLSRATTDCRSGSVLFDAAHVELQRMVKQ